MALEFLPNDEIRRVPAKTDVEPGAISMEIEGDGSGNFDKALDAVFAKDLATPWRLPCPPTGRRMRCCTFCR